MMRSLYTLSILVGLGSTYDSEDRFVSASYEASPTGTITAPFPFTHIYLQGAFTGSSIGATQVPSPSVALTVTLNPTSTVGLPFTAEPTGSPIPATIYALDNCVVPSGQKDTTLCPEYPQGTATESMANYLLYTSYEGGVEYNFQAVITEGPQSRELTRHVEATCFEYQRPYSTCIARTTTVIPNAEKTNAPASTKNSSNRFWFDDQYLTPESVKLVENGVAMVVARQARWLASLLATVVALGLW